MKIVQVPIPPKLFVYLTNKFRWPCTPLSIELDGVTYKLKAKR